MKNVVDTLTCDGANVNGFVSCCFGIGPKNNIPWLPKIHSRYFSNMYRIDIQKSLMPR